MRARHRARTVGTGRTAPPRWITRAVRAIWIMPAASAVLAVGCASDDGRSRANAPASSSDSASLGSGAPTQGDAAGANAPRTGGGPNGRVPPGAMTPEEVAAQLERDQEDLQRLHAKRSSAGSRTGSGAPVSAPNDAEPAVGAPTVAPISSGSPAASGTPGTGIGASMAGANAKSGAEDTARSGGDDDGGYGARSGADGPGRRRVPETVDALASAASALYRDATRADSPMRSLMALAALSIADPDRAFNPEALPDLTEEERRTLSRFHEFCRELGRQLATSDDPVAVARAVEQLAGEMRGERRLRVPRGEFCTRVDGFGSFGRIDPREFTAHAGARFVLYFEVDGYRSTEVAGEGWKTELSIELSILSERDGVPVWRRDWQTISDLVSTQRKDFFVTHVVALPDALSVGAYAMKVRVRDEGTGALAEHSIPFRMVASPTKQGGTATKSDAAAPAAGDRPGAPPSPIPAPSSAPGARSNGRP